MKGIGILFWLSCIVLNSVLSQVPPPTGRNALYVLGAWGTGNLIGSTAGFALQQDSEQARAFHTMNIAWSGINVLLSCNGLLKEIKAKSLSEEAAWMRYRKQKNIFLINTLLDVGYMGAGTALSLSAKNSKEPERNRGFGDAIIYNGAFLFIFDGITWLQYQKNVKLRMGNTSQGFYWAPSYNGATIGFRF
jgi:hypothetical protein